MAVIARGSTGCSMVWSSSASAEILELDLNLLAVVFCVSAFCSVLAKREDMLPLFLPEDYCNILANFLYQTKYCVIDLLLWADATSQR